ncbi:methylenetetrahydrofolate reductase C-terminal domain-containing protein [Aromatoleum toluclasticum]|uniref:Methylene-tetrahydrofolate reductase C-terminal-like domain-containing protein n=1 Tax=Aromatoleum petrolei TaxID=76116 RepID=A0ABX1MHE3_9RHOO|nr:MULTISPECIES: methylenetetrahydrofolate reductase C-terminal domain-containing protein [Aromatoleum]MCC4118120.1 methylenetetrahydrofolate reductase C-terminal domain-containing protein [Aromatoleum toluclasticum]NMF87350.1 hypothetical protein [Aromatoleum petrolei]QTQ38598.1 Methylene-tetrahydrofolate reductase, C terminal domain-containing protein [Aromatoleum petrolei]
MYAVRRWVVRHSRGFEMIYNAFEPVIARLDPLWRSVGYARAERPVAKVERAIKGFLFDCKMCGQCALSSTGMSCPMNCPKTLRNGPCGGVRANGHCEVKPEMKCVWAEAWAGSQQMKSGKKIHVVQKPVDNRLRDTSSWLRVVRKIAEQRAGQGEQK